MTVDERLVTRREGELQESCYFVCLHSEFVVLGSSPSGAVLHSDVLTLLLSTPLQNTTREGLLFQPAFQGRDASKGFLSGCGLMWERKRSRTHMAP